MSVEAGAWVVRGSIGGIALGLLLPLRSLFNVNSHINKNDEGIQTRANNIKL